MTANGDKYVTYRVGVAALAGAISLLLAIGWYGWQVHLVQPHPGAATHRETSLLRDYFEAQAKRDREYFEGQNQQFRVTLQRFETKLDQLIAK